MVIDTYVNTYLPGTDLYVDSINHSVDGIVYDAAGYKEESRTLYHLHTPQRILQDIGLVKLSRKIHKDTDLYIFAKQYHPLFIQGIEEELANDDVYPYSFEEKRSSHLFKPIPKTEKEEDQKEYSPLTHRVSTLVEELIETNPRLKKFYSLMEEEFK